MMDGITILSEETVRGCGVTWPFIACIGAALIIGSLCFLAINKFTECNLVICSIVGIVVSAVLIGGAIYLKIPQPEPDYTIYKVFVNGDVSLNEFSKQYEIINQDGKILTIVERDTKT